MRNKALWPADEVEARTKELEREIVRRLVDEGADLILETDVYSRIDGFVERNGKRTSVAEIKTRTEPLAYFEEKGSFLFDAGKISNLLEVAKRERLRAVVFVMTGDERLFFAQMKAMPTTEMREARKNHHSTEYVKKLVCLIPLDEFLEIEPKIHEAKADDIRWGDSRTTENIEKKYRSEEILEYYRERMAICIEDGGLSEWEAKAQAEKDTQAWLQAKLREGIAKIGNLGK